MKGLMVCYDDNNNKILEVNLLKLPIKEKAIIEKSIKLYNEDEPCIIYRTAIINRVGLELSKKIEEENKFNTYFTLEELINFIGEDILTLPKEITKICFL